MKNVAILFGGQSAEHEVSIRSARNVFNAIDRKLFNPILIGVSRTGCFYKIFEKLMNTQEFTYVDDSEDNQKEFVSFVRYKDRTEIGDEKVDCVFCLIHGQSGEDGVMPGLCEAYNIDYVGCGVLSSAICMDKVVAKLIAIHNEIPVTNFISFSEYDIPSYDECVTKLGSVFFMKIANLGSSVGVYKIKSKEDFDEKLKIIWRFGNKVLVESAIDNPQEIEVAVFESDNKVISYEMIGEIKPKNGHEFYSYESKYIDPDGADLIMPANISRDVSVKIREMAIKIFKVFYCNGMARIDFLVSGEKIIFNELNTIPGFTNISMYPMLAQNSGVTYSQLITNLINSSFTKKKINIGGMMRDAC